MKFKTVSKGNKVFVKVKAENGNKIEFDFRIDSVVFMNFFSVLEKQGKYLESDEEAQAKSFLKIFEAAKKVLGHNFDAIVDFAEDNDEEFEIVDLVSIVSDFNKNLESDDLPKG